MAVPASVEERRAALEALRREAESCRRCDLWRDATQLVFGEGPVDAPAMLVGEQPGDVEDRKGRPFVGPAGRVLDRALAEVGLERERLYITNAVKHFKFASRGRRRIHQKPDAGEIEACRVWLLREIGIVDPPVIGALGATALRALTGRVMAVTRLRGRFLPWEGRELFVTVHPSSILRIEDEAAQERAYAAFRDDLAKLAARLRNEPPGPTTPARRSPFG